MSALSPPPNKQPIAGSNIVSRFWAAWFQDLQSLLGGAPFPLKSYLVADVPDAVNFEGHMIYLSDESGGAVAAFSDGTDWRRVTDRAIIS